MELSEVKVGDVVYVEGASAILGDVLSVDVEEDQIEVRWRGTTSTEVADDLERAFVTKTGRVLTREDMQALADEAEVGYDVTDLTPTMRVLTRLYPGLQEWSRERYVGNECDTDEYRETQPAKGLAVVAEMLEAPESPDGLLYLVQAWVAALQDPDDAQAPGDPYAGAEELTHVLAMYHDWLWIQMRHPYDTERPGDYFDREVIAEFLEEGLVEVDE